MSDLEVTIHIHPPCDFVNSASAVTCSMARVSTKWLTCLAAFILVDKFVGVTEDGETPVHFLDISKGGVGIVYPENIQ